MQWLYLLALSALADIAKMYTTHLTASRLNATMSLGTTEPLEK